MQWVKMKATLTLTIKITDDFFTDQEEKLLFEEATLEQKHEWLKDKFKEEVKEISENEIKIKKLIL